MTRETIHIQIRAFPSGKGEYGNIRAVPAPTGIPIYKDQMPLIISVLAKARSIEEARKLLYAPTTHYDKHHLDSTEIKPLTVMPPPIRRPIDNKQPAPSQRSALPSTEKKQPVVIEEEEQEEEAPSSGGSIKRKARSQPRRSI